MRFAARIYEGVVHELVELPEGVPLDEMFHPEAGFVPCDETVALGMTHDGENFAAAPEPQPEPLKAAAAPLTDEQRHALAGALQQHMGDLALAFAAVQEGEPWRPPTPPSIR